MRGVRQLGGECGHGNFSRLCCGGSGLDEHAALAEQLAHRRDDVGGREARLVELLLLRGRLDELVGQYHRSHAQLAVVERAVEREHVQHVVAEATDAALLDGDEHVVVARQLAQQLHVERLHEARVRHRDAQLPAKVGVLLQRARGLHGGREARAQREQGHALLARRVCPLHVPPATDGQRRPLGGHGGDVVAKLLAKPLEADAVTAREAHGARHGVELVGGGHHVQQLELVGRRHDHQAGQTAQVSQVERAVVRGAVVADQARAVKDEAHGQLLRHHVVHHLVVATLEEGAVDRHEGLEALHRQPGGEGDGVLLGDAHVKGALGEAPAELVDPRAARHRRRDRDDLLVVLRVFDERVGEDVGVGRLPLGSLVLVAGGNVKLWHAVVLVRGGDGGRVAEALLRFDVEQHGLVVAAVADVLEDRHEVGQVVPVYRADVVEAELLEQVARRGLQRAAREGVDALVDCLQILGQQ
mmetsp:Transcript_12641/g.32016  ORF Transcript_12641/g.32016 Transcript_12641/m.32016 type:complete len:472 (-) Transcript_12641:935-2350(-)